MKKLLLSLALLSLMFGTAYAADSDESSDADKTTDSAQMDDSSKSDEDEKSDDSDTGDETSSADNRGESLIQIGYTPISANLPNLIAPPFTLGVHLGPDWIVALEASNKFTYEWDDGDGKGTLTFHQQGISTRWFTGNSFNIYLGVHDRRWHGDVTLTVRDKHTNIPVTGRATLDTKATVGTLAIGNQWQADWGGVIGVDWFNVAGAISQEYSYKVSNSLGAPYTPSQRKELDDSAKEAGDLLNLVSAFPVGAFNLYIAYSF